MGFLSNNNSFLGVQEQQTFDDKLKNQQQQPTFTPPAPITRTTPTTAISSATPASAKATQTLPVATPTNSPTGPTVGATPTLGQELKQVATVKEAPQQAPVGNELPAAETPAPEVAGERGARTDDKDLTTGIVKDATANNKAVATIAKTTVDDKGVVHYANENPDGSPKPPSDDKEGWSKLTTEQQRSAMQDYKQRLTDYTAKQAATKASPLDPDEFAKLDDAGKMAAIDDFLKGSDPAAAAPKTEVDDKGVVRFTEKDPATGKLIPPWTDADGWAKLTPEQQSQAKEFYAAALEKQSTADADAAAQGVAGTGVDQATWDSMSPQDQANALRGIKPPVQNPDGTTTQTRDDGSKVTMGTDGNVSSEVAVDGTETVYGTAGAKTITAPDGKITTTDNQGNTTVKYKEGTAGAKLQQEQAATGFKDDGSKMSRMEMFAQANPGVDVNNMTPKQQDDFQKGVVKSNADNWSTGEGYARAAVQAGLLTQEQYTQMRNADYAHSFGAWLANNKDVANALSNSNADTERRSDITPYYQDRQPQQYQDTDDYFKQLRGDQAYMAGDALTQQDFTNDDGSFVGTNALTDYDKSIAAARQKSLAAPQPSKTVRTIDVPAPVAIPATATRYDKVLGRWVPVTAPATTGGKTVRT